MSVAPVSVLRPEERLRHGLLRSGYGNDSALFQTYALGTVQRAVRFQFGTSLR